MSSNARIVFLVETRGVALTTYITSRHLITISPDWDIVLFSQNWSCCLAEQSCCHARILPTAERSAVTESFLVVNSPIGRHDCLGVWFTASSLFVLLVVLRLL